MAFKKKKISSNIDEITYFINKYKILVGLWIGSIAGSFWLGTYYEESKKNIEILNIQTQQQKSLLEQKEQYMDKYFNLRDKYFNETKNKINEK